MSLQQQSSQVATTAAYVLGIAALTEQIQFRSVNLSTTFYGRLCDFVCYTGILVPVEYQSPPFVGMLLLLKYANSGWDLFKNNNFDTIKRIHFLFMEYSSPGRQY